MQHLKNNHYYLSFIQKTDKNQNLTPLRVKCTTIGKTKNYVVKYINYTQTDFNNSC